MGSGERGHGEGNEQGMHPQAADDFVLVPSEIGLLGLVPNLSKHRRSTSTVIIAVARRHNR